MQLTFDSEREAAFFGPETDAFNCRDAFHARWQSASEIGSFLNSGDEFHFDLVA